MIPGLGHYRIIRKLGEGDMGVVYEAHDERLDRAVAIKTLRAAVQGGEGRERLWREARSLARVSHPNICQINDAEQEGDTVFLVLELLQGETLAQRLNAGPVPAAEALGIECQILRALDELHRLSIVHHDLKPSNVFLTTNGVKLVDFGVARIAA
jgi:serine/threonine protein kinase